MVAVWFCAIVLRTRESPTLAAPTWTMPATPMMAAPGLVLASTAAALKSMPLSLVGAVPPAFVEVTIAASAWSKLATGEPAAVTVMSPATSIVGGDDADPVIDAETVGLILLITMAPPSSPPTLMPTVAAPEPMRLTSNAVTSSVS